jgi:hypothetical protein
MLTLNENPAEKLASDLWESWRHDGINPRNKTYLEIKRLADHFLKICREQEIDYKQHDFSVLIDSNLNYYENQAEIENALSASTEAFETAEAFQELNDKLKEDYGITVTKSLKPVTELEQKNKELTETNKRLEAMLRQAEEEAAKTKTVIQLIQKPAYPTLEVILYTPAELKEIMEYLQTQKHPRHPKPIKPLKKLYKAIAKILRGSWNFLSLVKWAIYH